MEIQAVRNGPNNVSSNLSMLFGVSRKYTGTAPPAAEAYIKIQEEESDIVEEEHDIGWSRSSVLSSHKNHWLANQRIICAWGIQIFRQCLRFCCSSETVPVDQNWMLKGMDHISICLVHYRKRFCEGNIPGESAHHRDPALDVEHGVYLCFTNF